MGKNRGDWPDEADGLAKRFGPGPLTLEMPRRDVVPDIELHGTVGEMIV